MLDFKAPLELLVTVVNQAQLDLVDSVDQSVCLVLLELRETQATRASLAEWVNQVSLD